MPLEVNSILRKFLTAKPKTLYVWQEKVDRQMEEVAAFTEAEWAKKKTEKFHVIGTNDFVMEDSDVLRGGNYQYKDGVQYYPVVQKKIVSLVRVGHDVIDPSDIKKFKKMRKISIDLSDIIGYGVGVTELGMSVGCQDHTWSWWSKEGNRYIESRYGSWSATGDTLKLALALILENREKIVARLTATPKPKKTAAKKAAKRK